MWIDQVPGPATVHDRLLLELGARILEDPDGGDLCAFVREWLPPLRLHELVLDALDRQATALWWAALFGGRAEADDDGAWSVGEVPGAPFEWFVVNPTTSPESGVDQVHVEVGTGDLDRLLAHGARLLHPGGDTGRHVLADPEGGELAAVIP